VLCTVWKWPPKDEYPSIRNAAQKN